jgi:ketol-acid reductoisomerase
MGFLTGETKQQQLERRRSQVLSLSSAGYSQREIVSKLQVNVMAVTRDIRFLKQQAQNNLQHHIHEVVPMEYERCMTGMKNNLKQTLEIAETVADPRVKLQARAIVNDCYKYIMDLTTGSTIISDAMNYVIQKSEQVNTLQNQYSKKSEKSLLSKQDPEGDETTTNGVF